MWCPKATPLLTGVTVLETPGHTKGHMSILANGEQVLIAGDALPESGTLTRGLPCNIFLDVEDAQQSVEKVAATAKSSTQATTVPFESRATRLATCKERLTSKY